MPQFIVSKMLGWAVDRKGNGVLCHLITFRDHTMALPGGACIAGDVTVDKHGDAWLNWFEPVVIPTGPTREVKKLGLRAYRLNREGCLQNGIHPEYDADRYGYFPDLLRQEGESLYLVSFTEREAVEAAYQAGYRVDPGRKSPGDWRSLQARQEREAS